VELAASRASPALRRYEGIDQRALDLVVDDEISLGDFVLAAGAGGAVRHRGGRALRPGLGNDASSLDESSVTDCSSTRTTPAAEVRGAAVPEILRSVITPGSRDGARPGAAPNDRRDRPHRGARG